MSNAEKIKQLEKELEKYTKRDDARLKVISDQQKIAELKKQIRAKKYGGLIQVGKNLKAMGKSVGKTTSKFIGEDPKTKGKRKVKSVEEVLRDLPQ